MFYVLLGPSFHVRMGTEHTEEGIRNCHRLAYSLRARDSQLTSTYLFHTLHFRSQ